MIVGVLTTCHTQYTWDRSICIYNISLNSCQNEKYFRHSFWIMFFSKNFAVCEIMWDYLVEPDKPQMTIQYIPENMLFSCRVKKTRKKRPLRIYNTAFPRQQWLGESVWMLRYKYIVFLTSSALSLAYAIIYLPLYIKFMSDYVRLCALFERLVHCR